MKSGALQEHEHIARLVLGGRQGRWAIARWTMRGGRCAATRIRVPERPRARAIPLAFTWSDGGPSASADAMRRISDPYVTTKAQGMGLGPAISRTFVEENGGSIHAENGSTGGADPGGTAPAAGVARTAGAAR